MIKIINKRWKNTKMTMLIAVINLGRIVRIYYRWLFFRFL